MLLNSQQLNPTSFKVIINNHSIAPKDYLKNLDVLDNKLIWKPYAKR